MGFGLSFGVGHIGMESAFSWGGRVRPGAPHFSGADYRGCDALSVRSKGARAQRGGAMTGVVRMGGFLPSQHRWGVAGCSTRQEESPAKHPAQPHSRPHCPAQQPLQPRQIRAQGHMGKPSGKADGPGPGGRVGSSRPAPSPTAPHPQEVGQTWAPALSFHGSPRMLSTLGAAARPGASRDHPTHAHAQARDGQD